MLSAPDITAHEREQERELCGGCRSGVAQTVSRASTRVPWTKVHLHTVLGGQDQGRLWLHNESRYQTNLKRLQQRAQHDLCFQVCHIHAQALARSAMEWNERVRSRTVSESIGIKGFGIGPDVRLAMDGVGTVRHHIAFGHRNAAG
jgi:hypothetical protein